MYTPAPIYTRSFFIRDQTAAQLSYSEKSIMRAESMVLASPYQQAIRKALSRLEAISTISIDGKSPELTDLYLLEAIIGLRQHREDSNQTLNELMQKAGMANDNSVAIETYRYMTTVEWVSQNINCDTEITPETILELRSRSLFGSNVVDNPTYFRTSEFALPSNSVAGQFYKPPPPEMLPALIEDYCMFVNHDTLTPVAQAAFSHFHFESLKPFCSKLDRLGRMMSHVIWFRRGLVKSLIAPIALLPALKVKTHVKNILPYNLGLKVDNPTIYLLNEQLIEYCACCTDKAAQVIETFYQVVSMLDKRWRCKLGKIERDSALDRLLNVLPGSPYLTVCSAMELINKSFSSTNDAIARLRDAGILLEISQFERNHIFAASEAVEAFAYAEKHLLPYNPVVRDEWYKRIDDVCPTATKEVVAEAVLVQ